MGVASGKTQRRFPVLPEKGKPHQEQSQACAPTARWLSAGRLLKSSGNGTFRQMAAAGSSGDRTRLMVHRVFFLNKRLIN